MSTNLSKRDEDLIDIIESFLTQSVSTPSSSQLDKIASHLKKEIDAEEWLIIELIASDNLINRSFRKWHKNILKLMEKQSVGIPLLVDHNWDEVRSSAGFIIESKLVKATGEPDYQKIGFEKHNKKIIETEGHLQLQLTAALPQIVGNKLNIEALNYGLVNACSTGGAIHQIKAICPNCSETHGREIGFMDKDKNGNYICPHLVPSMWSLYYASNDNEAYPVADYVIYDGLYENLELSLVNIGNLPNARVLR